MTDNGIGECACVVGEPTTKRHTRGGSAAWTRPGARFQRRRERRNDPRTRQCRV